MPGFRPDGAIRRRNAETAPKEQLDEAVFVGEAYDATSEQGRMLAAMFEASTQAARGQGDAEAGRQAWMEKTGLEIEAQDEA